MSYLIRSCTAGIVLSRSMKENFNFLIPPENVHVVSNFSEDIFFKVDVKEKNTDILRLCYLSNVMRDKGIFILLDALAILDNKGVDYCCKIAGAVEKDLELEFADRVDRFGPKVQYIGSVSGDHKHSLLMNSNVMVLPTFYEMEGQPISLLEGLASGNIIVSTDHSGIPDVVNRDNGFLVKTQDSNGLAFVLEKIAANIATEVNRFSQHNQCYAKENFSETRFGERISLIISNVEAR